MAKRLNPKTQHRDGSEGKARKRKRQAEPEREYQQHPLYGAIPLLRSTWNDHGWEREILVCDPEYKPSLPAGGVRANVRKQLYWSLGITPRYYYLDQRKSCIQCDVSFDFSAQEQKFWYEALQFPIDAVAIRCPKCRRQRRTLKALNGQIGAAKTGLRSNPDDPIALINLAQAILRYHQQRGEGNLDEAIAASRRAQKLWPAAREAIFWEAACHFEAGRPEKGRALCERFLRHSARRGPLRQLLKQARGYLERFPD